MKRISFVLPALLICQLICFVSKAQAPVDYRDVAVIVNTTSKNSIAIGNYFMKKRNIPPQNLIKFTSDTAEEIDSLTFQKIRYALKDSLVKRKGINYLVTTKGCPLKIHHTNAGGSYCDLGSSIIYGAKILNYSLCASFESEVMLILSKDSSRIGKGDVIDVSTKDSLPRTHSYFENTGHFSTSQFGFFLITRLDGIDYPGVMSILDRSGPNTVVNKDSDQFVLDNIPWPGLDTSVQHSFLYAYRLLKSRGWKVNYDSSASLIDKQRNVLGYMSWGADDAAYHAIAGAKTPVFLTNAFSNASIADIFYSYTGKTFTWKGTGYKFTALPYLPEGLTGTSIFTYEPFSFAMAEPTVLFGKYTDSLVDRRYNLAESYIAACGTTSWMSTIIGDPKTSIVTHIPPMPKPSLDTITKICEGASRTLNANNSQQGNYNWFSADSSTLKSSGQPLDSTNKYWAGGGKKFTVPSNTKGTFTFTYVNENMTGRAFKQFSYSVEICTGIDASNVAAPEFDIYPNPAHKQFTLSFNNEHKENLTIQVTDMLGREIFSKSFAAASSLQENIDMNNRPAGIYFVTLTAGNLRTVKKMMIQ